MRILKLLTTILNYQEIVAFLYPLSSLKVHESLEKEVGGIKDLAQIYFHVLITFNLPLGELKTKVVISMGNSGEGIFDPPPPPSNPPTFFHCTAGS